MAIDGDHSFDDPSLTRTGDDGSSTGASRMSAWPSFQPCQAIQTLPSGAVARTASASVPAFLVSRLGSDHDRLPGWYVLCWRSQLPSRNSDQTTTTPPVPSTATAGRQTSRPGPV